MHLPAAEACRKKVQLTAVLKDPRYLSAIREPTEKVQLAAVQKKSGMHPSYSGTDGEGAAYGRPEESGYLPADQAA